MFRLFSVDKEGKTREVFPENDIYVVYELYEYVFTYNGEINRKEIFIEDELFDETLLLFSTHQILLKEKQRIFEDYFGYLTLQINNDKFKFEVRIQKLKVPELEDILLYLWNQDPIIFDNFFSKSTLKSKLGRDKNSWDYSSKFVNIFEDYYIFFKNKYITFKSLPHSILRTKKVVKEYEHADISSNSVDWLVTNLDELHLDYLYKNVANSIRIHNNYGLIENILTEEKISDFNVYENQIILGSFEFVIQEISKIKTKINTQLTVKQYYEQDFYSIDEFKVIPFIRLKDDLEKIEYKIKDLQQRYQKIFTSTKASNSFPRLTPVFSNKKHYSESYIKIKLLRDISLNLDGELNLLNIKKISTLYERFNLFVLINSLLKRNPISFNKSNPKLGENIFQEFKFQFQNFNLDLFYDYKITNQKNKTGLVRISSGYYRPDYILKVTSLKGNCHFILDSKYSSENTVKYNHITKCVKSYILDIGISDEPKNKVKELVLLYPGENEETLFGNEIFEPKVSILPSKTSKTNLADLVDTIINLF